MKLRTVLATALAAGLLVSAAHAAPPSSPAPVPVKKKGRKVRTGIEWKVAPSSVVIYPDDKKLGTAGDLDITRTRPGMHTVRLVNGEDEAELDVKVKKGQTLRIAYEFSE